MQRPVFFQHVTLWAMTHLTLGKCSGAYWPSMPASLCFYQFHALPPFDTPLDASCSPVELDLQCSMRVTPTLPVSGSHRGNCCSYSHHLPLYGTPIAFSMLSPRAFASCYLCRLQCLPTSYSRIHPLFGIPAVFQAPLKYRFFWGAFLEHLKRM